jgi:hypothetical protein
MVVAGIAVLFVLVSPPGAGFQLERLSPHGEFAVHGRVLDGNLTFIHTHYVTILRAQQASLQSWERVSNIEVPAWRVRAGTRHLSWRRGYVARPNRWWWIAAVAANDPVGVAGND